MKNLKRFVAVMCTSALCFSIVGCDGNRELTPEQIINKIEESTKDAKNFAATMSMDMEMSSGDESVDMSVSSDMKVITDPEYKAQITMNMDMGSLGAYDMDMYLGKEGDKYYTYTNMLDTWSKQEMDESLFNKTVEDYNQQMNFDIYLKNVDSFSKTGEEEIDGKNIIIIEGTVSGESLEEVIEQTQVLDQMGVEDIKDMYKDLGDLPVKFWVDEETYIPSKIYIDMKDMMNSIMSNVMESQNSTEELDISKCDMEMEYKSIGDVEDFDIPQEALEATLIG